MSSNTSFTGSGSKFSRSNVLASSVCLSPLNSLPSKTQMWALKFVVFLCFRERKITKTWKKSWNFWQGHVKMTPPRQVVTTHRKTKYTIMCGRKFWEKPRRNFRNMLWFRSYAAKSRPGGKSIYEVWYSLSRKYGFIRNNIIDQFRHFVEAELKSSSNTE